MGKGIDLASDVDEVDARRNLGISGAGMRAGPAAGAEVRGVGAGVVLSKGADRASNAGGDDAKAGRFINDRETSLVGTSFVVYILISDEGPLEDCKRCDIEAFL